MTTPRVLVVDDNPDELVLTQAAFAEIDPSIEVSGVPRGEAALAHLDATDAPPFLVLLDMKLPGISGLETLRHIRRSPRHKRLPVAVFSSSSLAGDAEAAIDAGADAFLHKMLSIRQFTEELRRLLARLPGPAAGEDRPESGAGGG